METMWPERLRDVGLRVTRPRLSVFELRVGDNHHHLVCRSCGAVGDVDCAVGAAPCLSPSDAAGFVLDEAEVVFWGLCSNCQQDTRGGTTA